MDGEAQERFLEKTNTPTLIARKVDRTVAE